MKLSNSKKAIAIVLSAAIMNIFTAHAQQPVKAKPPKPVAPANGNMIFTQVDNAAGFPGGFKAFTAYFIKSMEYPKVAVEKKIQGRVYVSFVVERGGTINNVRVLRGIGGGCDEEAVRVVKNSAKWIPAKHNGQIVRSQFTMPVAFTLSKA